MKRSEIRNSLFKKLLVGLSIFLLFSLGGCEKNKSVTGPTENNAKFEITKTLTGITSYGRPFILIEVKNVGNLTGYNVSCYAYAIKGTTIVDTGFAYFSNGNDIRPGESVSEEAVFFNLRSHSEYEKLEYKLDWLTRKY